MLKSILKKYNDVPDALKATLWFVICNVVQKGVSLLTTPIFTRIMTTQEYGEYTLYSSWYQVISIFATLNLFYGVYNNGMTKFSDDRKSFTSSLQGLCTAITVLWFLVYIVAKDFWNDLLGMSTLYMLTMFAELLMVPAFNFWSASQRYDYRYKSLVGVSVLISCVSPIIGFIAVINTTYKAEARVLSIAMVQIIIGLILYILNMMRGKTFFSKKYWKFALAFNIPLIPHYLSSMILGHADRIMIGAMVGKSEAALYSVAYNIALMMNIVISAVNASFTPYMYKSIKSKNYAPFRKMVNLLVLLMGALSVGVMTVGPELINIVGSKDYADAIGVIPPVAASTFFMFLYPIFSNVEFYYEKTKFIMVASCAGALLNIALNYLLIPILGYYAAAYTTLLCYIIYVFVHYLFSRRICKVQGINNSLFDIKRVLLISLFVLIIVFMIPLLYPYFWIRLIIGIAELLLVCFLGMRYLKAPK